MKINISNSKCKIYYYILKNILTRFHKNKQMMKFMPIEGTFNNLKLYDHLIHSIIKSLLVKEIWSKVCFKAVWGHSGVVINVPSPMRSLV